MTAGATAITFFHRPADGELFDRWAADHLVAARRAPGYVSARESVHEGAHLDWAFEVTFDGAESLDEWLDSSDRQAVLTEGQLRGFWRSASEVIFIRGEPPPADTGVFLHSVAADKDAEFIAAQCDLTLLSSAFPGYEGTAVFPADSAGQWLSVLRFRTSDQLGDWIRSRERQQALPRLRDELTHDFAELPRSAPFGSTVRVADGQTRITPAWKTALLVVLCLYPTVMLLSDTLAPTLSRLGVGPAPAMFVGNVISVILLQWVLVPSVSRPFRRWLDPIDGASARVSWTGAAIIVAGYGALLLLFTLIGD